MVILFLLLRILTTHRVDCHHSYASRDIIGVCTTVPHCVRVCKEQAAKEGEKIDNEQLFNLSGAGEFQFEDFKTNQLL